MSSGEWLFVHFTHVEDGLRARVGKFLNVWGQRNRSSFLKLEESLRVLFPFVISKPPPVDLNTISGRMILVNINDALVRAKLFNTTPSPHGLVEVWCIDLGSARFVPQTCIRSLNVVGVSEEAIAVAQSEPFAQKYILADIVSQDLWPDRVMHYAKALLENQSWKAYSLGNHGFATGVILYNNKNVPLNQEIIECGMGMLETSGVSFPLPTPSSLHVGSTRFISPPISHKLNVASEMKLGMNYEVIVTNIEDSVRKFAVQLKESEAELQDVRRKLNCVELRRMRNPIRGKPCLALFSRDLLLRRGLVANCYEDKCSVYYIDYGNVELRDSRYIFELPDELVDIKQLACRVSLADSDELEHLNGVAEAFASIVAGKIFKMQVVDVDRPRKVFLFDENGRNVKDVIISALLKKSFSPSQHLVPSVRATPRREQFLFGQLAPPTSRVSVQVMICYLFFYPDTF